LEANSVPITPGLALNRLVKEDRLALKKFVKADAFRANRPPTVEALAAK
jgi:hypothetical protein